MGILKFSNIFVKKHLSEIQFRTIYAVIKGHFEIVEYLAQYTSNPNAADNDGDTPLHHAAYIGHLEIVKFLALNCSKSNAADQ